MTKARTAPVDLAQQLAEANATIEVLRRSVHAEHAGAAEAYAKLGRMRERLAKAEGALAEILPLAESYLSMVPDRRGHNVKALERARAILPKEAKEGAPS